GGKVDPGETPAEAAVRELQEEAGITAALEHRGTLFFMSAASTEAAYVEIYYSEEFSGIVTESEEMRPQWFLVGEGADPVGKAKGDSSATQSLTAEHSAKLPRIPYEQMWEDDRFWLPRMLAGQHFAGRVDLGSDGKMLKWWFGLQST
ncbi:hypothetical protein WOLCODRAFT_78040, partial [Wolfiporia cocos MD-104 SS10]